MNDFGDYFDLTMDKAFLIRTEMMSCLQKFGIYTEMGHHEVGEGHHEINIRYDDALKIADNVMTFKVTLKAIAEKHGLLATFVPKPLYNKAGSGMHTHQSLFDDKGNNVFYDAKDEFNMSDTAKSYIAGQLKYIKEISAITNPLINSYKRLGAFEAPVHICWAQINRSALIRVPAIRRGKKNSARIELRNPDPCCNPYLAFALMLKAGLEGIRKNLKPPEPINEDVYHFDDAKLEKPYIDKLPKDLKDAIGYMKKSKIVKEVLGPHLFARYIDIKDKEWDMYRFQVHKWELDQYLEKY